MSDCKVFRREIGEASGRGDLGTAAVAHVAGCRACGETLREREAVRLLVRGLGKVEAPADFEFRLRARMAAADDRGRRGPFGGLRLIYKLAPVAIAVAFLVVSASLYFRQSPRGSQDSGPAQVAASGAGNAAGTQIPAAPVGVDSQPPTSAPVARVNQADSPKSYVAKASAPSRHVAARRLTVAARGKGGAREVAALNTTVASVRAAEVIHGRTLSIPMATGAAPLRLVVRDGRGAARFVPVRPVSFGAQDVIAGEGARRQTAAVDDEGVW